jgi:asparagine synthase (glutamine-hydrolysing)
MCGIAGYFGAQVLNHDRLAAASRALRHRGPDGDGFYQHGAGGHQVALMHRRLAIIDLEPRSNQPFRHDGGVLCYNGEIYNYVELRRELEALGESFQTEGDTEVLAHALRRWGPKALEKCEGMWAIAWYDERNGTLLLSRDRFGEKPLYLWRRDGGLYFGSEVKGIAAMAGGWPPVNQNHLLRYLINGYKALYKVEETYFQGVSELPAGSFLLLKTGSDSKSARYWSPRPVENSQMSFADAVEATREAVLHSVKLRLRADVPLAFCMSGGIDSNSLIATAKKVLGYDVHGFTIVNSDARYEEQDMVHAAVRALGVRHTEVAVSQEGFLDNIRTLVAAHDAPVSTISYYVHWQLMQAVAAHGYKVSISGTAADELFTGYYDHHNLYLYEIARDPVLHAQALANWQTHLAPIVRNPYLQKPDLYLKNPAERRHIFLNNDVFSDWLHKPWSEDFAEQDFGAGLLRNRMLNELFAETVPVILHEDDLNAMYFSIENRSPFLDTRLFDVAYSIPARHLVQDGRAKSVLREAMRGIVPDAILDNRRKVGFNAPILDLLDPEDRRSREFLLDDGPVFDLVRKDRIEALLSGDPLANSASKFLFYFINMKLFLEQHARAPAQRDLGVSPA